MDSRKLIDSLFILVAFAIYMIILNTDEAIENANVFSRHIWFPLILSYYIGRYVSLYKTKQS